jgi:hypothetical protein
MDEEQKKTEEEDLKMDEEDENHCHNDMYHMDPEDCNLEEQTNKKKCSSRFQKYMILPNNPRL